MESGDGCKFEERNGKLLALRDPAGNKSHRDQQGVWLSLRFASDSNYLAAA